MVLIGAGLGAAAGSMAGRAIGKKYLGDDYANESATIGGLLGGAAGTLLPFATGGLVPGAKGKPRVILAHNQEYILPIGVKPTKAQKSAVEKRKKQSRQKQINVFV